MRDHKYDFFISHASEDKELVVKDLALELTRKGFKVWYDEFSISPGCSLTESIQEGIKNSYYGLVILSPNFFKKEWTKKELSAILTKEIVMKENLILPIWHEVTLKDVYDYSPLVADRFALTTSFHSVSRIVEQIQEKVSFHITSAAKLKEKIDYLLQCNKDRMKKEEIEVIYRIDSIFSFQSEYYNWYMEDKNTGGLEDWDEKFVISKELEFKSDYKIPLSVWTIPEPFEQHLIDEARKLAKRWLKGRLSIDECNYFYNLLEEELDTDVFYILYGLPHGTMKKEEAYPIALEGIAQIGTRKLHITAHSAARPRGSFP